MLDGLANNSFLKTAGILSVGGSVGGVLFSYIKNGPHQIWTFIKDRLRRTLVIRKSNSHDLFMHLLGAIAELKGVRITQLSTLEKYLCDELKVKYNADNSSYKFQYKNKKLYAKLTREKKIGSGGNSGGNNLYGSAPSGNDNTGDPIAVELYSYFLTLQEMQEFCTDMITAINSAENTKIRVMGLEYSDWTTLYTTERRGLDTLIFEDPKIGSKIKDDIKRFLAEREWYKSMNIPHRRGYLFNGEPGNGKTSLIRALATELNMNIALVNIAQSSDDKLVNALSTVPENCLLVFEDIDSIFTTKTMNRQDTTSGQTSTDAGIGQMSLMGPSFSGILNAIDGLSTSDNRIIIMTTNHKDVLDPALLRPGRLDKHVYIGNPHRETIERMFRRFFPDDSEEEKEQFLDKFINKTPSMSHIQEELMVRKEQRKTQIL